MSVESRKKSYKKWAQSEKGKASTKRRNKRYRDTHPDRIKEQSKKWDQSGGAKIARKKYNDSEYGKEKHKERQKKYQDTDVGKEVHRIASAKRKRDLGYVPLNEWFEGCEGHHVDKVHVIYIPKLMHNENRHRQDIPESMNEINRLAFEFMEGNSYKP